MNKTRVYGMTCVLIFAAMVAQATTIVLPSDEQLIAKAPVIIDGTVLSSTVVNRDGAIWTDTEVAIARVIKGDAAGTITVREIGGVLDERITKLFGTPQFIAGEHVLLFLEPSPRGGYRTMDLYVGKFSGGETQSGQRLWMRDDTANEVTLLDVNLQPLRAKNVQRHAEAFETFVRERVAGRNGSRNYGIENPILARDAKTESGTGGFQSDFTLISEPTIYRWFRFASGQTAQWYSSGTQPGYSNGGVSELLTAMQAWTGYSSARIDYSYVGARSGSMGGLDAANGVNEVLFNDPLNEISGTWNRNTGGVVGTGGFNGVSSQQNFTTTFAADATHPAGTLAAWNIIEGNLTIQDGVSSSTGISSNVLAEIVAHEFGHTLGFGHSADSGALMYASVTGAGPSLRTDDQTAARWLYPNGSVTPPPPTPTVPAAPSSLAAVASGSNIDLSWVDNATNETGQRVYLATSTGAFSNVANVGANARTARLSGLAAGGYRIYVVAYNAAGNSAQSNTATATIASVPVTPTVTAAFDVSTSSPTTGQNVAFTDRSSGAPTRWSWSFGDGATSTAQNPTHAYSGPGSFTVTLTASNATSSATASRAITVSSTSAYRTLVSVATYGGGVGGTAWRTELNLFNAGAQGASVTLVFLPTAGGNVVSRSLFLSPRQLVTYANALVDLFGISSGAGALAIEATSAGASADLRVSSRTFTTGLVGTYGQSVPDVQSDGMEKTLYITGIASNASFRTNIGLVNRGSTPMSAMLTLYSRTGSVLSSKSISIAASSFQQAPLASFFPEVSGASHDVLTMRIAAASSDAISAYASVVDNLTQDPVYIQARRGESGGSLTIPVVGRAPGANGTFWRSDLTLFNPGSSSITLTLRYGGATKALSLGGNDTAVLADVLSQFGLTSSNGALRVTWSSSTGPVVTSRTYTSVTTGGTYGQSIDPVSAFASRVFVPGLRNDVGYRSNVGFVNGGNETEFFTVTLLSPFGTELARNTVTLIAGQQTQTSVSALFPNVSLPTGFTLQAQGDGNAQLFAYGSMVDNASGDPVFFAGR